MGTNEYPKNSNSYKYITKPSLRFSTSIPTATAPAFVGSNSPTKQYAYPGEDFMEIQKKKDIQRALYWKRKGYNFDPNYTTSFMMNQKVEDIQRANYWKTKGYNFNPDYMTGFMMDQKVSDIQRAAYWKAKGLDFNPDYMTSFMMDMEASNKGIH